MYRLCGYLLKHFTVSAALLGPFALHLVRAYNAHRFCWEKPQINSSCDYGARKNHLTVNRRIEALFYRLTKRLAVRVQG
jgi:hypothetical protein